MIRHSLTALAGLGGLLVSRGLADPGDAAAIDQAGTALADSVSVILAAVIMRGILYALGKLKLPASAGAFGLAPLLGLVGTAAGLACLPSCSTTVTKTTMPDGTVVEVTAKSSDAAAIGAAVDVSRLVVPILIHPEK